MSLFDENGVVTEEFNSQLPEILGDDYYNDPATKQQPTKMFENIKDEKSLIKMAATAQRMATQNETKYAEKYKGMVRVPNENSPQNEVDAFRAAIGVPRSADDYQLSIPQVEDESDKQTYELIARSVKDAAHKIGVSQSKVSEVWNSVMNTLTSRTKEIEDKGLKMKEDDIEALKKEWKEDYQKNYSVGDKVIDKLEAEDFMQLMKNYLLDDHPLLRKILFKMAPLVLEGKLLTGKGATGGEGGNWPLKYDYDNAGKPK
jgi:hypothetical protein